MSEPVEAGWLRDRRIGILVWNGFTHDARVLREARSLARQGAEVRVICLRTGDQPREIQTDEGGVEIQRIENRSWLTRLLGRLSPGLATLAGEVIGTLAMAAALVRFRPGIVHSNDANTLIPAWIGVKWSGAGFVYDAHEISADREGYRGRAAIVKFLERYLGHSAHAWITTTGLRARWFEENYGVSGVHVVQNRPHYSAVTGSRIRERLPIPADEVVFLYQGGLQPGRGLRNLVSAAKGMKGGCLVMVGGGVMRDELEALAVSLEAPVHFVGQVDLEELPYWTASADVGMQVLRNTCLNHYTTDSNKLFEYAMGGLAVVASDFPEIRAVVERHELGLLVDPEDVDGIRSAMQRLASDAELRERLRANARQARVQLDWYSQEPAFFDAYREALGHAPRSGPVQG